MTVHTKTLLSSTLKATLGVISPQIPAPIDGIVQPVTDGVPFGKRNQNVWVAFQGSTNDVGFIVYGLFNNIWFRLGEIGAIGLLNNAPVTYPLNATMQGYEKLFIKALGAPGGTPEYSFLFEPKL